MPISSLVESNGFKIFSSKTEKMGFIVLVIGLSMHIFQQPMTAIVLMVGFSTLALLYFLKDF